MTEHHIHIHIPAHSGAVHVTVTGDDVAVSTDHGGPQAPGNQDAVESMLRRFERYDSLTGAREVLESMQPRGWEALVPQPRGAGPSSAAYLRFVLVGTNRKATLFMDSAAVFASGKHERPIFEAIGGAEIRSDQVRVNHSGDRNGTVEAALAAVEQVEAWVHAAPA